jgi:c-di-GMP-binding flagellar brake protein YcgR
MTNEIERRRTPRISVKPDHSVQVELRHRVRVVDISQSGVLVSCDAPLPVGVRGQLRTGLAAAPFAPEVVVERQDERAAADRQTRLGSKFSAMDEQSRRSLEQFLRRSSE